jgi:tight adherence protein C
MVSDLMTPALITGTAVGLAVLLLTTVVHRPVADDDRRRAKLRKRSVVYRLFEPTVSGLTRLLADPSGRRFARLDQAMRVLDLRPWRGDEFTAVKVIEAVPVVALATYAGHALDGPETAVLIAVLGMFGFPYVFVLDVIAKADLYVARVRGRLPFTLDLMALMLEAGAGTLQQCLQRAAAENVGHPIGTDLRRVLTAVDQGVAPREAFGEWADRLGDPDVRELVTALTTAEDRGIPLRDALRTQADRVRMRQTQWLEKSAEQAKVHITWPGMVVMIGCLIIVGSVYFLPR